MSEPSTEFADAVREHLMVPTSFDNDGDGKPDEISVDIIRPAGGAAVPVILESSPYYYKEGRGPQAQRKKPNATGIVDDLPLFYDNYFVPRGYAFAAMDNPGTGRSTGCMDVLGDGDIGAAKQVVEYLASQPWSSGKVAMIGKSYDATVATGVAATGVDGLVTVVPIAGISDTYDYGRHNGIVRFPHWVGWYASKEQSDAQNRLCKPFWEAMDKAADDASGLVNEFWQERNLIRDMSSWKASALVVQGLTDFNVQADQSTNLWKALAAKKVPRQMWLTQAGHVDPFDADRERWIEHLHQWFDYWLLGLDNGVMDDEPVRVQSNQDLSVWRTASDWPESNQTTTLHLGAPALDGGLATTPDASATPETFVDDVRAYGDPGDGQQLVYRTSPLGSDLRLSGQPTLRVTVSVQDAERAQFGVKIQDVGQSERVVFNDHDGVQIADTQTCYSDDGTTGCLLDTSLNVEMTSQGLAAHGATDIGVDSTNTKRMPLRPGAKVTLEIELSPLDMTIPAGNQLQVVLSGTDTDFAAGYLNPCEFNPATAGESCSVPANRTPAKITVEPGAELILPTID